MVGIFSIFIFNRWRVTQKQKKIIEVQKAEVEKQKEIAVEQKKLVEEKNKDITDSINYAKRIQTAMLIPEKEIYRALHDFFILFKPNDAQKTFEMLLSGKKPEEIAKLLGVSRNTVYTHKKRISDRLKREIGRLEKELG